MAWYTDNNEKTEKRNNGGIKVENNLQIDFKRIIVLLWEKWWIIAISTIIMFLVGNLFISETTEDMNSYSANVKIYSVAYQSYEEASIGMSFMQTYADIISSNRVCKRAALLLGNSRLSESDIRKKSSVSYSEDTSVLIVQGNSNNPDEAIKIANAVSEAFIIELKSITGLENIQVLDEAKTATISFDANSNRTKKILLVSFIGFFLSIIGICIYGIFSDIVYDIKKCEKDINMKVLGVVPDYSKISQEKKSRRKD